MTFALVATAHKEIPVNGIDAYAVSAKYSQAISRAHLAACTPVNWHSLEQILQAQAQPAYAEQQETPVDQAREIGEARAP